MCQERLVEIAQTANADTIFAGKCYRLLLRHLKLHLPIIDSNRVSGQDSK